jgi:hypothetical protein
MMSIVIVTPKFVMQFSRPVTDFMTILQNVRIVQTKPVTAVIHAWTALLHLNKPKKRLTHVIPISAKQFGASVMPVVIFLLVNAGTLLTMLLGAVKSVVPASTMSLNITSNVNHLLARKVFTSAAVG